MDEIQSTIRTLLPPRVIGRADDPAPEGKAEAGEVEAAGEAPGAAAPPAAPGAGTDSLLARASAGFRPGLDEAVQKEAAALTTLVADLEAQGLDDLLPVAEVAFAALLAEPPNRVLAAELRADLHRRIRLVRRPLLVLRTGHAATQVILGLATNLLFAIPLALLLLPHLATRHHALIPGDDEHLLIWVGVVGALGSIVSILVRMEEFERRRAPHRDILFFTGLFKPVIGVLTGLFLFFVVEAGLLPIAIQEPEGQAYFYLALAFVAGFSERLATDLVARAERRIGGEAAPGA